jgi:tetratricopeptide (TPR) repeat protein
MRVAEARSSFYVMRGDVGRARGALDAAVERNPSSAAPYVAFARFLLRTGRTEDAERQIERALAADATSLDARRMRCEIEFSRGKTSPVLSAQIEEVERAAAKSADAARLLDYLRGKLAALQGDLRVAKEMLARYVAAVPGDADAQYALGAALAAAGEFADAIRRFEAAGALLPGSPEVRVALAKARQSSAVELMNRGRFVEAQSALRLAASDDPSSRDVHALYADSLRLAGDVELSELEVRALLRADPSDRAALRMLGAIEVQEGRLDAAAATLRKLVAVAPDDWSAWRFLSAVLADKGDLDAAETAAKACSVAAPDEPGALAALLHVLALRGDFAGAERAIESAAAKRPDEAQYPCYLAMLRAQQGRHEDAVAAAGKSLDLRPANPAALRIAVDSLSNGLHDSERAAAFARERASKAKDDAGMTCVVAWVESELGRRTEALALLEPVCATEAPPPFAVALRGLLLLDAGDFASARAALKKGIEARPESAEFHYLLAQGWLADPTQRKGADIQEPARGLAVLELRAALRTSRSHAPAMNNLAWLLSRDEATRAEALALAEAATRKQPGHAPYLDTLATVLSRMGRDEQAVDALRRALAACEAERALLDQAAAKKQSTAGARRLDARRARLDRVTAEVKGRLDEALRASTTR